MKEMTYQEIIDAYGHCIFSPVGKSMLPLIKEGIDTVKLVKMSHPLKKYDVILYQRADGHYILHRIVSVHDQGLDLMGDNQWTIEKNVQLSQVIAILEGVYHKEKYIPVSSLSYRLYVKRHMWFSWLRRILYFIKRVFSKIFKK